MENKGRKDAGGRSQVLEYGSGGTIAAADHTIVRGHDYVIKI